MSKAEDVLGEISGHKSRIASAIKGLTYWRPPQRETRLAEIVKGSGLAIKLFAHADMIFLSMGMLDELHAWAHMMLDEGGE